MWWGYFLVSHLDVYTKEYQKEYGIEHKYRGGIKSHHVRIYNENCINQNIAFKMSPVKVIIKKCYRFHSGIMRTIAKKLD